MNTSTTALQLPFDEISNFPLATQKIADTNFKLGGRGYYVVPISKIVVREKFNVREDMGDLEELADSLRDNGQIKACLGDVLADGNFMLTDGHRRYEAMCILRDRDGLGDLTLKCEANQKGITDLDRCYNIYLSQDNKQLNTSELARLIKNLVLMGEKQKDIAKKLRKTDAYISQMLSFGKEDDDIKGLVVAGKISASAVVKLQGKIPDQEERKRHIINALNAGTNPLEVTTVTQFFKNTLQSGEEISQEFPLQNTAGATDDDDDEIKRQDNTKSNVKREEIDNADNSNGRAIQLPKNNSGAAADAKDQQRLNRSRKIGNLCELLIRKYELKLDDDGIMDLYNTISENL